MDTSKGRNLCRYGSSSDGLVMRYLPRPLLRESCHKGIGEGRQSNSTRDRVVVKGKRPSSSSSRAGSDVRASSATRRGVQASRDFDRVGRSKKSLDRGFSLGPSEFDSR